MYRFGYFVFWKREVELPIDRVSAVVFFLFEENLAPCKQVSRIPPGDSESKFSVERLPCGDL